VISGVAVHIRRGVVADAGELAGFAARTFAETFGADNRPEDLEAYLASAFGEARQAAELSDPALITLLAEGDDGSLAAYAQLVATDALPACVRARRPIQLKRFYVGAAGRGSGLAQRLMTSVRAAARAAGASDLWLGVWERNPRAIAFYVKEGFADVGSTTFLLGTDPQVDRVMVAAL